MMTDVNSKEQDDLEAWKQVHRHLVLAITMTKDAINAEKVKRRFLLEEIYLNLKTDGTLAPTSKWSKAPSATRTQQKQVSSKGRRKKRVESGVDGGVEFSAVKASRKKASQKKKPVSTLSNIDKVDAVSSTVTNTPPKKRRKSSKASLKKEPIVDDGNDEKQFAAQRQHQQQLEESPDVYNSYKYETSSHQPLGQTEAGIEPSTMSMYMPQNQESLFPPDPADPVVQQPPTSFGDLSYNMDLNATAAAIAVASQVAATAMANFNFNLPTSSPPKEDEEMEEEQHVHVPESFQSSATFHHQQQLNYERDDVDADHSYSDADAEMPVVALTSNTISTSDHDQDYFSAGTSEHLLQQMLQQHGHGGCDDEEEEDPF